MFGLVSRELSRPSLPIKSNVFAPTRVWSSNHVIPRMAGGNVVMQLTVDLTTLAQTVAVAAGGRYICAASSQDGTVMSSAVSRKRARLIALLVATFQITPRHGLMWKLTSNTIAARQGWCSRTSKRSRTLRGVGIGFCSWYFSSRCGGVGVKKPRVLNGTENCS
jgi:hypothetical protein